LPPFLFSSLTLELDSFFGGRPFMHYMKRILRFGQGPFHINLLQWFTNNDTSSVTVTVWVIVTAGIVGVRGDIHVRYSKGHTAVIALDIALILDFT
jgi:hypothetical protein